MFSVQDAKSLEELAFPLPEEERRVLPKKGGITWIKREKFPGGTTEENVHLFGSIFGSFLSDTFHERCTGITWTDTLLDR